MNRTICFVALLVSMAGLAVAQGPANVGSTDIVEPGVTHNTPPSYCKPCLFYGGDWNDTSSNWVAYGNTYNTVTGENVWNYSPFKPNKNWNVTGLFTNNLATVDYIDPKKALWWINSDLPKGNCGKVVENGESAASFVATGRSYSSYKEYTVLVKIKTVALQKGTEYWQAVVPECTVSSDCGSAYYYETDTFDSTETKQGAHHYGPPEPKGQIYGYYNGSCSNGCNGVACWWLSDGVIGTSD